MPGELTRYVTTNAAFRPASTAYTQVLQERRVPSLRDFVNLPCAPGTAVPGFLIPPLRGWPIWRVQRFGTTSTLRTFTMEFVAQAL